MTESVNGLPPLLQEGLLVAVVPPPLKEDRWHRVTSVSSQGGLAELVHLSGVDTIGDAERLVGKLLLASVDDLPSDLGLHDPQSLVGRRVEDSALGLSGTIEEVMVGPANDVWVLHLTDREGHAFEYLIPVVDEVVSEVGPEGPIAVHLPAGLEPERQLGTAEDSPVQDGQHDGERG